MKRTPSSGFAIDDGVEFQELLLRYPENGILKPRLLWKKQRDIVASVEENDTTAVKGCHGSGKTFGVAGIALHWLARYQEAKVVTIAPTLRQVKNFVGEVELARRDALFEFFPPCTTTGLFISPDRQIIGASASKGVNVHGYHSPNLLVIVDEAPGVHDEVIDAIHGMRASGNVRMIKLGNPVHPSGNFFNDFGKNKSVVAGHTISAFDTPNLLGLSLEQLVEWGQRMDAGDERAREFMRTSIFPTITRMYVYERWKVWGVNHPKFVARVLGEFPSQSDWAVFSLEWIERAKRDPSDAELKRALGHRIQVGIDVAAGGDAETSLAARVDGIVLEQRHYTEQDPGGTILKDLVSIKREYADRYPMGAIVVDTNGPGLHLAPRIAQAGYEVYGFNAGGAAMDGEAFFNAKSELYWQARRWFKEGLISGLNDEETEAQLSTLLYSETGRGKTYIETKKDAKKREGADFSPDRAEALIISFLPIVPRSTTVQFDGRHYEISRY